MSSIHKKLQGTGVALVTPFTSKGFIDFSALAKIIEHVISGGVEYIVSLGTTGETPTLNKFEKTDVLKFTYEKVNDRLPIVVGIGGNNTKELVDDIKNYPLEKAAAVLSASPYYSKPSQEGLFQHYKALAHASPKPVILYNVPSRTGRGLTADTILRLANETANIAGIKEASGDMALCMQLLRDAPKNFLVVSGDDALALPQIACGMKGVISVAANAYPKVLSDMVRAALAGDFAKAKQMNDALIEAYAIMFEENNPAGIKALMAEMKLLKNNLRLPLVPVSEALHNRAKAYTGK